MNRHNMPFPTGFITLLVSILANIAFAQQSSTVVSETWTSTPTAVITPTPTSSPTHISTPTVALDNVNTDSPIILGTGFNSFPAYSPDGKKLAVYSWAGAFVWDVQNDTVGPRLDLLGHTGPVTSLEFSPDQSKIVTGSDDKTVRLWDADTGNEIVTLSLHEKSVKAVSFLSEGRQILSAGEDGIIKIWDLPTQAVVQSIDTELGPILSLDVSHDGHWIVTGHADGPSALWNRLTGKKIHQFTSSQPYDHAASVEFAFDDSRILRFSRYYGIKIFDRISGQNTIAIDSELPGYPRSYISSAHFSPDGCELLLAYNDVHYLDRYQTQRVLSARVQIWDSFTGILKTTQEVSKREDINSAVLSPDQRRIVTCGTKGTVRTWEKERFLEKSTLSSTGNVLAFSPDNKTVLTAAEESRAILWDLQTRSPIHVLYGHHDSVVSGDISSDNQYLLTGDRKGFLFVWDKNTGELLREINPLTNELTLARFSPHNAWLLSVTSGGTVALWDREWGNLIRTFQHDDYAMSAAFSLDMKWVATCGNGPNYERKDQIKLWDLETGALLKSYTVDAGYIHRIVFLPNGVDLAAESNYETSLRILNLESGKTTKVFTYNQKPYITPDGRYILVAVGDAKSIEVRDYPTNRLLRILPLPTNYTPTFASSLDHSLISGIDNLAVTQIWDTRSWEPQTESTPTAMPTFTLTPTVTPTQTPTPTPIPELSTAWTAFSPGSDFGEGIAAGLDQPRDIGLSINSLGIHFLSWTDSYAYQGSLVYPHILQWNGSVWRDLSFTFDNVTHQFNNIYGTLPSHVLSGLAIDPVDQQPLLTTMWGYYYESSPSTGSFFKWDGSRWNQTLAARNWSPYAMRTLDLGYLADKTPLLLYSQNSGYIFPYSVGIRVYRNNQWEEVSPASGWNTGITDYDTPAGRTQLLSTPSSKIFTLWEQEIDSQTYLYIRQWIHSTWRPVGIGSASERGLAQAPARISKRALVLDSNERPIISYESESKIFVKRFNGQEWVDLGLQSSGGNGLCEPGRTGKLPILVNPPSDYPVVIWQDQSGALYAKQFNGTEWVPAGEGAASGNGIGRGVEYDAAVGPTGVVYIAYLNEARTGIYMKRYGSNVPPNPFHTPAPSPAPTAIPNSGWFVLDGFGGIHSTNPNVPRPNLPYWSDFNIVRDIEPDPLGRGWYMLDGFGGIHTSSPDLPKPVGMPYLGSDLARDLEVRLVNDTLHFYLLDGFGAIHSTDPTFNRGKLMWIGADLARDLEPNTGDGGWWMLDAYGVLHSSRSYRFEYPQGLAWKIPLVKDIIILPDDTSVLLDAYGGKHTDGGFPAQDKANGFPPGFYFPGWEIIQDVEAIPINLSR